MNSGLFTLAYNQKNELVIVSKHDFDWIMANPEVNENFEFNNPGVWSATKTKAVVDNIHHIIDRINNFVEYIDEVVTCQKIPRIEKNMDDIIVTIHNRLQQSLKILHRTEVSSWTIIIVYATKLGTVNVLS